MVVKAGLLASAAVFALSSVPAAAQQTTTEPTQAQQTDSAEQAADNPDPQAAASGSPKTGDATAGDDKDVIVVTGNFARSLAKAMDKKRNSPIVIEALSISDLNQLPDVSVADALSRLPGLAASRDSNNGAKSQISLRGMGAALTLGTLNSRDLATATPDRNIRYDQFPSELIGGATVYKSQMASIVEGGVSGSIDLQTVHPLDFKKDAFTVSLQGAYNELGDQYAANKALGWRGSASYIGRFFDDTVGIAIGYAQRDEPYNEQRTQFASFDPGGYTDYNGDGFVDDTSYGLYRNLRTGDDKRKGAVAVLEWKPSSNVHLTIDGLWSKVKLDGDITGVSTANLNQQWANTYTNTIVVGGGPNNHGSVVGGTVTATNGAFTEGDNYTYNLDLQPYSGISRRNDKLTSLGGNLVWNATDRLQVVTDLAFSKVNYKADYWELRAEPVADLGGYIWHLPGQSITFDATGDVPTFTTNVDLTDPNVVRPYSLSMPYYNDGKDKVLTYRNDLTYKVNSGFLDNFRVGLRYVDRHKRLNTLEGGSSLSLAQAPVLSGSEILPNPFGSYDGKQANAGPDFLSFDFFEVANTYFGGLNTYQTDANKTEDWDVREKTLAGYAQVDFGGSGPLTGNVGVRVVKTRDRSSSARLLDPGTGINEITPITVRNSYTDVLPSLNLTYHATDQLQFRLGLAKAIARPAIDDLNAGIQIYNYAAYNSLTAYGGNPKLEPYRTKQIDLGAEWYFGKNDFVAATAFYKKLDTYITTSTSTLTIDGQDFQFFSPVNANGGHIQGIELTFQKSFTELPSPLDGLGIYANYAHINSNVSVSRNYTDVTLGLLGLSKNTGTATLWYSKYGIDARLSYNYQGSYPFVVDGGAFETVDGAGYLDAQISYEILKGVSPFIQASNLTNTPYSTHIGNLPDIRGRYAEYGRIFYAGVRATF